MQVAGDGVRVEAAGGGPDGTLGTDGNRVAEAIRTALRLPPVRDRLASILIAFGVIALALSFVLAMANRSTGIPPPTR